MKSTFIDTYNKFMRNLIKESLDDNELREAVIATVEKANLPEGLDKEQVADDIFDLIYGKDFDTVEDLEQGVLDYINKTYGTINQSVNNNYTFDEQQFEDAWSQAWNNDEREDIQRFFRKGRMPVSKIKQTFKDLCQAVSDGKNDQAYQIWRKVGTSGFLNRLMWAQGYDCKIPKTISDTGSISFVPHKKESLFKFESKKVNKSRKVIKEDADTDKIIEYWRSNDVDETTFPDEKLQEFIDEFYITPEGDYQVYDLNDTNDGELGDIENIPMFNFDELVFVYLLPDNKVQVESGEGNEQFEDWVEAKDYLIEQGQDEGAIGFDTEQDDQDDQDDVEEQSVVPLRKYLIKEDMEPGYWEKVEQYKKDIQAYLDKGNGEEYNGFEGYVDEENLFEAIGEIIARNPDKLSALENELISYIESCPGGDSGDSTFGSLGLYQDIVEGNEGYSNSNVFYGLKDPELYTDLGFELPEDSEIILKQYFVDVAEGSSFWEGDGEGYTDDGIASYLDEVGLNSVVDKIEESRSEYEDQDQDFEQDQNQDQDFE